MNSEKPFVPEDLEALSVRGIGLQEALAQLERLQGPSRMRVLFEPAVPGHGIEPLDETSSENEDERDEWLDPDSLVRFIPASGAATRMFQELRQALLDSGTGQPVDTVREFFARLPGSALAGVAQSVGATGVPPEAWRGQIQALLDTPPAALAARPKALIPFHFEQGRERTALEQQLREAQQTVGSGHCRVHLTVSPEHKAEFRRQLDSISDLIETESGVSLEVKLSCQDPASDTIALNDEGELLRDNSGALIFRPAGHGALIRNLDAIEADHLFIKNIDNIGPTDRQIIGARWARQLLRRLLKIEARVHHALHDLSNGSPDEIELAALVQELGVSPDRRPARSTREEWIDFLNRPIRVAGVVPNTGAAGGGPFYAADPDDPDVPTLQIVEQAEVDTTDPEQLEILQRATHFNPVLMAVSKRRFDGGRFELERFIDTNAWLRVNKSFAGKSITALERPGLWNGAMARWSTIFVEIPTQTFQPVKTIFDLLIDP